MNLATHTLPIRIMTRHSEPVFDPLDGTQGRLNGQFQFASRFMFQRARPFTSVSLLSRARAFWWMGVADSISISARSTDPFRAAAIVECAGAKELGIGLGDPPQS